MQRKTTTIPVELLTVTTALTALPGDQLVVFNDRVIGVYKELEPPGAKPVPKKSPKLENSSQAEREIIGVLAKTVEPLPTLKICDELQIPRNDAATRGRISRVIRQMGKDKQLHTSSETPAGRTLRYSLNLGGKTE